MNTTETSQNRLLILNRDRRQGQQLLLAAAVPHLEFMWLKFTFSGFSGQRNHVLTDGSQALYVCIEHNRCYKACRSTHCNANVHYVISARHNTDASYSGKTQRISGVKTTLR